MAISTHSMGFGIAHQTWVNKNAIPAVMSGNDEVRIILHTALFLAKKRLTKRAPDAGESAQISSSFLRLFIFLAGRLRRPRPSAGNANR